MGNLRQEERGKGLGRGAVRINLVGGLGINLVGWDVNELGRIGIIGLG